MTNMMNREIKQRWLTALRGGEYKQAKRALHTLQKSDNTERFCVLGVLCDLYVKDHENFATWRLAGTPPVTSRRVQFDISDVDDEIGETNLTSEIIIWADLQGHADATNDLWLHDTHDEAQTLSALNDKGASFKTLAKLIEKEY